MTLKSTWLSAALLIFGACLSNPVPHHSRILVKDNSPAEAKAIGSPDVVEDGGRFVLAYAAGGDRGRLMGAVSSDGLAWVRTGVLLEPAASGWDSGFLDTPALVKTPAGWFLYYFGDTDGSQPGGALGVAVSADGVHFSRVFEHPFLAPVPDSWESNWLESPTVQYDSGTGVFHLWYSGAGADWLVRTGHATSTDGLHWTRDPANPVLREPWPDGRDRRRWDGLGAAVASVSRRPAGGWLMVYGTLSVQDFLDKANRPSLGAAVSQDGTTWQTVGTGPLIGFAQLGSEPNGPWNPCVLERPDGLWIWYETGLGLGLVKLPAPARP